MAKFTNKKIYQHRLTIDFKTKKKENFIFLFFFISTEEIHPIEAVIWSADIFFSSFFEFMVFGKLKGDLFIYSDYSTLMIATFLHFTSSVDATAEGYLTVFFSSKCQPQRPQITVLKINFLRAYFQGHARISVRSSICLRVYSWMQSKVFMRHYESLFLCSNFDSELTLNVLRVSSVFNR